MRQVRTAVEGLTRRTHSGDELAGRFDAIAEGISAEFRRKLAALRQRLRPWEMAAAVRALQDERDAALRILNEQRMTARYAARMLRRIRSSPRARPS